MNSMEKRIAVQSRGRERDLDADRKRWAVEFIARIADMTKDGETRDDDDEGAPFEMTAEDAIDTVHSLIDRAREFCKHPGSVPK